MTWHHNGAIKAVKTAFLSKTASMREQLIFWDSVHKLLPVVAVTSHFSRIRVTITLYRYRYSTPKFPCTHDCRCRPCELLRGHGSYSLDVLFCPSDIWKNFLNVGSPSDSSVVSYVAVASTGSIFCIMSYKRTYFVYLCTDGCFFLRNIQVFSCSFQGSVHTSFQCHADQCHDLFFSKILTWQLDMLQQFNENCSRH